MYKLNKSQLVGQLINSIAIPLVLPIVAYTVHIFRAIYCKSVPTIRTVECIEGGHRNVSEYNLVNETNLVHNLFLIYLYLSISTCFGRLWAHHQEIQLCLCDTWYLLFCVDDWYAEAYAHAYQSSTQNNKY